MSTMVLLKLINLINLKIVHYTIVFRRITMRDMYGRVFDPNSTQLWEFLNSIICLELRTENKDNDFKDIIEILTDIAFLHYSGSLTLDIRIFLSLPVCLPAKYVGLLPQLYSTVLGLAKKYYFYVAVESNPLSTNPNRITPREIKRFQKDGWFIHTIGNNTALLGAA